VSQPEDWSIGLARVIAGEVRRYRQAAGLSTQRLADRCAELGLPLRRSVLANLESGRRDSVSVAELLVLAAALGVAPVLLVLPVGRAVLSEVLPRSHTDTWSAAEWFCGRANKPFGDDGGHAGTGAVTYRAPIELYADYYSGLRRWVDATAQLRRLPPEVAADTEGPLGDIALALTESMQAAEKSVRDAQDRILNAGLELPEGGSA
jgi:transcriptional regulator with XRE-family HTH domain